MGNHCSQERISESLHSFFPCPVWSSTDVSHNQLELILNVLGTPTIDEFYAITSRRSKEYIRSLPFRKKIPFRELYPKASKEAIDFLDHTLTCMSLLSSLSLIISLPCGPPESRCDDTVPPSHRPHAFPRIPLRYHSFSLHPSSCRSQS